MKLNKYLKMVRKEIPQYFSYFKDANILVVSESKEVLPFAYIIRDVNTPSHLLLSIAVDYPFSQNVVELALATNKIKPVAISDEFYIAKSGNTHLGDDALKYYDLDSIDLDNFDGKNEILH